MRSITMKHFRNRDAIRRASYVPPEKNDPGQVGERVALGQIVGDVWGIKEKEGELPGGEKATSLVALGEFVAVNYADQEAAKAAGQDYEPMESNQIYLPSYFAEQLQAMLGNTGNGAGFAIELYVVPNSGKGVPYMYEVKSIMKRANTSRLHQIMVELERQGQLRIPVQLAAPQATPAIDYDAVGDRAHDRVHDHGETAHDPETGEVVDASEALAVADALHDEPTAGEVAAAEEKKTRKRAAANA